MPNFIVRFHEEASVKLVAGRKPPSLSTSSPEKPASNRVRIVLYSYSIFGRYPLNQKHTKDFQNIFPLLISYIW